MTTALIIVDVQNDYFPGGNMELVEMDQAAKNCALLLDRFRNVGAPVFHIQHFSGQPGATFFIPDTPGCEINESVAPEEGEPIIQKNFPSAFRDTELHQSLQDANIDELVICGAMTHMCIDTTTRAAFDLGYKCNLIGDGCATRDLEYGGVRVASTEVQAAYLAALGAVFSRIVSATEYNPGA